ncbi:MAG TPA: prenyltransferase/squalene oxidase repeat-containing protein [Pirellulales bacterium]|nr:prenyltransferase/squalene oxidase repeat-containing protein [Pirellulales bacterium]
MSTASHESAPFRGAKGDLTPPPPLAPSTAPPAAEAERSKAALLLFWALAQLKRFWRQTSSWLCSLIVHALLIIILGWAVTTPRGRGGGANLVASLEAANTAEELSATTAIEPADRGEALRETTPNVLQETSDTLAESIPADAPLAAASADTGQPPTPDLNIGELLASLPGGGLGDVVGDFNVDVRGALGGRGAAARSRLAREGGATPDSETAVDHGLRWLQAHQSPNGSWHFDLKLSPCQGLCGDSGTEPSTTAATGLALLAFLGHGETHLEGQYQDTVKRGLYYLTSQMHLTKQGGDLRDQGRMYAQGISTIALCEAYAMTQDRALEPFAQHAIDYIVNAQHKQGGGWRYMPGEPGDTTVTGWQLMALKSGQMAYLRVPLDTLRNATRFLDSVQFDQGSRYKYQPRVKHGEETTNTAIGLLCRMYTGWLADNPALQRGVGQLSGEGPSMLGPNADMYYNYYATQIMHQWGGEIWTRWNNRLRDFLVQTQSHEGHESGSWNFNGGQAARGGRLYNTAMAIMTLEVYYRHMPLYREQGLGNRDRE